MKSYQQEEKHVRHHFCLHRGREISVCIFLRREFLRIDRGMGVKDAVVSKEAFIRYFTSEQGQMSKENAEKMYSLAAKDADSMTFAQFYTKLTRKELPADFKFEDHVQKQ